MFFFPLRLTNESVAFGCAYLAPLSFEAVTIFINFAENSAHHTDETRWKVVHCYSLHVVSCFFVFWCSFFAFHTANYVKGCWKCWSFLLDYNMYEHELVFEGECDSMLYQKQKLSSLLLWYKWACFPTKYSHFHVWRDHTVHLLVCQMWTHLEPTHISAFSNASE